MKTSAEPSAAEMTRRRLVRAAERLFAERGVDQTSTRAILELAGQRNQSALQYHFGGRRGLIDAIYRDRAEQANVERNAMAAPLLEGNGRIDIRQLCELILLPPVRLARRDAGFRRFLAVVGQFAFLPWKRLREAYERYEAPSLRPVYERLRQAIELPEPLLEQRIELISRFAMVMLAQRAVAGERFDGPEAELWLSGVLDAMAAIAGGPASAQTSERIAASLTHSGGGGS